MLFSWLWKSPFGLRQRLSDSKVQLAQKKVQEPLLHIFIYRTELMLAPFWTVIVSSRDSLWRHSWDNKTPSDKAIKRKAIIYTTTTFRWVSRPVISCVVSRPNSAPGLRMNEAWDCYQRNWLLSGVDFNIQYVGVDKEILQAVFRYMTERRLATTHDR